MRKLSPRELRCFKCLMLMSLGTVELLFLMFLVASWILCFGKLYICGVKFAYVSVYYSVWSVCCVFDGVGELFVECICYLLVYGGCFVAEEDSVVVSLCRFFVS